MTSCYNDNSVLVTNEENVSVPGPHKSTMTRFVCRNTSFITGADNLCLKGGKINRIGKVHTFSSAKYDVHDQNMFSWDTQFINHIARKNSDKNDDKLMFLQSAICARWKADSVYAHASYMYKKRWRNRH